MIRQRKTYPAELRARIALEAIKGQMNVNNRGEQFDTPELRRSVWSQIVAIANRHYQPGRFTTFAGYEWTSMPNNNNLHRNMIFRGANVPEQPFTFVVWAIKDPNGAKLDRIQIIKGWSRNGQTFEKVYDVVLQWSPGRSRWHSPAFRQHRRRQDCDVSEFDWPDE